MNKKYLGKAAGLAFGTYLALNAAGCVTTRDSTYVGLSGNQATVAMKRGGATGFFKYVKDQGGIIHLGDRNSRTTIRVNSKKGPGAFGFHGVPFGY
jgi:predicted sugar kinase